MEGNESASDAELVGAYHGGSREAFDALVKRHLGLVYTYAHRLTGDKDAANDIVQETFIKVWKHLGRYDVRASFRTWVLTIAHRTTLDWFRKKKHIPFSDFDREGGGNVLLDTAQDSEPTPLEQSLRDEDARSVERLLALLPPKAREVLVLHYEGGMTFDEIGRMLGEPLHTVKSRHRRALQELRVQVKGKGERVVDAHQNRYP